MNDRGVDFRLVSDVNFEDEKQCLEFSKKSFEMARNERRSYEATWLTVIAYYLSKQWVEYDPESLRDAAPQRKQHSVRYTENMVAPYVRNNIAQMTAQEPTIQVRPATGDPDDWSTSKTASRVMRSYWQAKALDCEMTELLLWGKLTGSAFLSPRWDPLSGEFLAEDDPEIVGDPPVTSMQMQPSYAPSNGGRLAKFFGDVKNLVRQQQNGIQPTSSGKFIRLGDLEFESVSPFFVYPDPIATCVEDARWVIDARMRSLDWIRDRYPKTGREVKEESASGRDRTKYADHVRDLSGRADKLDEVPRALVMTVYIAPTGARPEGLFYVVAGDKVLDPPRPLETRLNGRPRIPLFHYRDKLVPDRFWPASVLEDGLQPQTLFNKAISQQLEAANLCGAPIILNPASSNLKKGEMVVAPGAVWTYSQRGQEKPEPMKMPELPAYVQNLPNTLRSGFENVVSQHEVSQGQAPPNTRTGVALAFLAEKDQASTAITAKELRKVVSQAASCGLELLADKIPDEPRLAKIVGRGDEIDTFEFRGKDLRAKNTRMPGTTSFDTDVDFLSGLPKSKAAMQETVFRGIESGLIDVMNPEERRLAQKWAGFAIPDDADTRREDEAQQHMELKIMLSVEPDDQEQAERVAMEIHPWDNHEAHVAVIDRFLKRPDSMFMDPNILGRFLVHRQLHLDALMATMMAAAPGGPGQQPGQQPQIGGTMLPPAPNGVPVGDPRSSVPAVPVTADNPRAASPA